MKILPWFLPLLLAAADNPTAAPAPASEARTWVADTAHSSAVFRVRHAGAAPFWGRFDVVEGTITCDDEAPEEASVQVRIKADSVHTGSEGRDRHLKNADFFDAKQFPWVSFESTAISESGDNEFTVDGELTLRGVTKEVTALVRMTGEGEFRGAARRGYEVELTIKRSEWGMNYGIQGGALGDEVKVTLGLEMAPQ